MVLRPALTGPSAAERTEGLRLWLDIQRDAGPIEVQAGRLLDVLREPSAVRIVEVIRRPRSEESALAAEAP